MADEPERYNLRAIRQLLLAALSPKDFHDLFYFSKTPELRAVLDHLEQDDSFPSKIRTAVFYCDALHLLGEMLAEVKEASPRVYARFEHRLCRAVSPRGAAALVLPLPADLPDFSGRDAQIDQIRDQINQQGTVPITSIHGKGGMGKTALAVHVAHRLVAEGRFGDRQLYIDLKGNDPTPVDPVEALDSLLNAILGPDPMRRRDLDTLAPLWRQVIDGMDALLILDNAAGAAQVRPLLPGYPSCAVLVTSRQRFALARAGVLDLRRMRRKEACGLLQLLASRLEDEEADAIADLCGDLPLALRIAGTFLELNDDCPPERYAEILVGERTCLAQLCNPDDPNLDIAAPISLSVARLDDDSLDAGLRRAWALLSLFTAPFDRSAAAALWDEPDEDQVLTRLQALRSRSLVTCDCDSARYHQHDLVRLAAASELDTLVPVGQGEITAAHLRMARHYEQVLCAADCLYNQGGDKVLQAMALFDLEWPHIRAGQAWAAANAEDDDQAAWLCSDYPEAAVYLLSLCLHPRDWIVWMVTGGLSALRVGKKGSERADQRYGDMYLGEVGEAIDYYRQALEISRARSREVGDRRSEGGRLRNVGNAYFHLGKREKAIKQYTAALEISREIGDRGNEGVDLASLGLAHQEVGETYLAIDYYQQALDLACEIGDRRKEGVYRENLGHAYFSLGDLNKAIEHHTAALAISREISRNLTREIGDRRSEGDRLGSLGNAYYHLGEMHKAIQYYNAALEISEERDDQKEEGNQRVNLGSAYAHLGETHSAIQYYNAALDIACDIGDRYLEAAARGKLGAAYADLEELDRAIAYTYHAMVMSSENSDRQSEVNHSWNLGLLYEEKDPARAVELMEVRARYLRETGHLDADVAALYVEKVRKRL